MTPKPTSTKDKDILNIGGVEIKRGERVRVPLETAALYDCTKLQIPVEVIRGKKPGPVLFVSAAIHGDEINGVEICRRLLGKKFLSHIHGTLIVIPIVNIFGFNNRSRYLPDRRDLNRSFPGSTKGSLAKRMAHMLMKEVVSKSTHGIDLHTGAIHRTNLPQVRAYLTDPHIKKLAEGFGVPVVIHSKLRDGSLREAARQKNVQILLYEGGQALRFEEKVIRMGLKGCITMMKHIGMLEGVDVKNDLHKHPVFFAQSSFWMRAPRSGTMVVRKKLGDSVKKDDVLGVISDPFGKELVSVKAESSGVLIGLSLLPLINQGDAMFHIATFKNTSGVSSALGEGDY